MPFQFLIGSLKTIFVAVYMLLKSRFQFLIGSLKTYEAANLHANQKRKFQFLIGSLKTSLWVLFVVSLSRFQFLIGSLKTCACFLAPGGRIRFQFLIGSLKTTNVQTLRSSCLRVSIPHRQSKNGEFDHVTIRRQRSFNSS